MRKNKVKTTEQRKLQRMKEFVTDQRAPLLGLVFQRGMEVFDKKIHSLMDTQSRPMGDDIVTLSQSVESPGHTKLSDLSYTHHIYSD